MPRLAEGRLLPNNGALVSGRRASGAGRCFIFWSMRVGLLFRRSIRRRLKLLRRNEVDQAPVDKLTHGRAMRQIRCLQPCGRDGGRLESGARGPGALSATVSVIYGKRPISGAAYIVASTA